MKKFGVLLLLSVLLFSNIPSALAAVNLNTFRYLSNTAVRFEKPADFFVLDIAPQMYATMDPSLRDLRVYSNGKELGYALLPSEPAETPVINNLPLEIINKGMLQGTDTYSFTLKMPAARPGAVQVKLNRPEYLVKTRLSGSNDNKAWQHLKTQTLYGISGSYNKFYLEDIDYQYLKFDYDLLKNETLEVAEAAIAEGVLPKKTETPWEINQSEDNRQKTSTVIIDLGYNNRISQGITLETGAKGFYRQAELAVSNDKKTWANVTLTYLYRGQDKKDENLGFGYSPVRGRYLKITVTNEDNPPVNFTGAKIQLLPVRLLVKSPGAEFPLTLYWGNQKIPAPAYDVAYMLTRSNFNINELPLVYVKSENTNTSFKEELPPLTERIPFLMPAALAVAALLVGVILFRSIKHVEK